jgi:hypothetical protein
MPLWDMYCKTCDMTVEMLIRRNEESLSVTCKTCGNTMERKLSSGAFVVNGYNYKNGYSKH